MNNIEKLNEMRWSFSRVNSYNTCPQMFNYSYILSCSKVDNAMAQFGSFCHSLLERYYKGELEFFELSQVYQEEYEKNITVSFPYNKYKDLNESYFECGKEYFDFFEGGYDGCEILGVKQRVDLMIRGRQFIGYIDLIVQNQDGIIIVDHKSKSKFKNEEERRLYLHQLYLYALYIKEKYGVYPQKLIFNMFRVGTEEEELFKDEELEKSIQWFTSTIDAIYKDSRFEDKIKLEYAAKGRKLKTFKHDDFFCNQLCSVREHCTRAKKLRNVRGDTR